MRRPFIEQLTEFAEHDPRIILIIGDVGFSFIEPFKKRFPNQFLNAGASEQNMMGVATGMAFSGWKPVVYTMINFIIMRPYEQVRNDICYQNANVKLFGVKGSVAYKFLGFSHNIEGDEDIQLLGHLPNIKTYIPKTEEEVKEIMIKEYAREGPAYTRI